MPQIPKQYNRRLLPTASGGGGATRNVAAKATGGQAIGAALAGGAAGVASAFQDAQRRRDAINARLDSLSQHTGAAKITMDGEADMQAGMLEFKDQLQKQQGSDERNWKVWLKGKDGELQEYSPDDGAEVFLNNQFEKMLQRANDIYGPEAKAMVAANLSKQAFSNLSAFRSEHLKLRHDKQMADWQVVADDYSTKAADPTYPFRDDAKKFLDNHITTGMKTGIFSPTDAVKMRETMKATIGDKYWSQYAQRDPMKFLAMVNETTPTTVDGIPPEGMTVGVGKLKALPDDLNPEKLAHYTSIAFGQLQHQQAEIDRKNKAAEAQTKMIHAQTFRDKMARVLNGESVAGELSQDLNENKLSAEQGNTLRAAEHSFKTQNAEDPALKQASGMRLFDYTSTITKAKFGSGNLDEIEIQVSVDLERGAMLPADAQNVLTQIREAKGHLQSEAQQAQNQTIQAAHKNMIGGLRTTGPMDKYDALSEQAIEGADRDFYDELRRNPNADAWAIRDKVMKRWEPVVAERKNVTGEDAQVKLDDAKMQSMVQNGAMTPAGYKAWKEQGDTWRQIYKNAIEAQKHPPPPPSMWDRAKEFGSSFFQEADAGATE